MVELNINDKAKQLAIDYIEIEGKRDKYKDLIAKNEYTRFKDEKNTVKAALALTLAIGTGLGFVDYVIYMKMQEGTYYYTDRKMVSSEVVEEMSPEYMAKIDTGEEMLLLEYGPWEEHEQKNPFQEYASSYSRDLYAYPVGYIDLDSYEEYLSIDTTTLEGDVLDTEVSYVTPDIEEDERQLLVYNQDLDNSILVINEEFMGDVEGFIWNMLTATFFGALLVLTGLELIYWWEVIKSLPKEEKEKLANDLKKLENEYKNLSKDQTNAAKDLINIFDKYNKQITDEFTISVCKRLKRERREAR